MNQPDSRRGRDGLTWPDVAALYGVLGFVGYVLWLVFA